LWCVEGHNSTRGLAPKATRQRDAREMEEKKGRSREVSKETVKFLKESASGRKREEREREKREILSESRELRAER